MKHSIILLLIFLQSIVIFSQDLSMTYDGLERTYRLHVPLGYNPDNNYPLVINMHGLTSNAFQQELLSGFNNIADQEGIMVVYPNGIDAAWNVFSSGGVDDVGFISALIDTLKAGYSIDLNRVYATGMSMGGFMSYRLACELGNRIAAIAPVAGLLAFSPCNPQKPVPVLHIHGTVDPTVPYAGVPATISFWLENNHCPQDPILFDFPDINSTDSSTVTSYYYGPCDNSTEVILYSVINGEHSWPGSNFILGVTNRDINASAEIWNFFKKFDLQGSTGILNPEDITENLLLIYPNPARNYMTIELPESFQGDYNFLIYDMAGKLVRKVMKIRFNRFGIDCHDLMPGFYFAEIQFKSSKLIRKVIIY